MEEDSFQEIIPTAKSPRISRDEMNLAEFPLTVLSNRADSTTKTLEFKDSIKGKNGEIVQRSWIITGADKFGLPTASDEEVLLGLLKLTVDSEFSDRKVYFTRYELLRILRWTTEGRSYQRLQKALDRLTGVKIKATNAFYDNSSKSHSTRQFGIVDAYEINDGRSTEPKPSFFTWSDAIFSSFKSGFIKKLDLDFYLNLQSAVSKRLYRFLDKHFWYKKHLQINLFTLCHEKLGISRNYKFASSLKQQLDPALEELQKAQFVANFEYEGKGSDSVVHIYAAAGMPRSQASVSSKTVSWKAESQNQMHPQSVTELKNRPATLLEPEVLGPEIRTSSCAVSPEGEGLLQHVCSLLLERGIKEKQLEKLVMHRTEEALSRIKEIISYFDTLVASNSRLISKSPIGFLYWAVENPERFVLPGERAGIKGQGTLPLRSVSQSGQISAGKRNSVVLQRDLRENLSLEAEYSKLRNQEILKLRQNAEPNMLDDLQEEAEIKFVKLRKSVSLLRFKEVVDHSVNEHLLKLFAFPPFEEWVQQRKAG